MRPVAHSPAYLLRSAFAENARKTQKRNKNNKSRRKERTNKQKRLNKKVLITLTICIFMPVFRSRVFAAFDLRGKWDKTQIRRKNNKSRKKETNNQQKRLKKIESFV